MTNAEHGALPRDDVFREVFAQLHFPFLSADTVALAEFLVHPQAHEGAHLILGLKARNTDRHSAVVQAFASLIRQVKVPPHIAGFFSRSVAVVASDGAAEALASLLSSNEPPFNLVKQGYGLRWDEMSPWPAAYRHFLIHLGSLVWGFGALIEQRRKELMDNYKAAGLPIDGVEILDQTARVLPTRYHYAAASLGAWSGGAKNVQFFSYFASGPQISNPAINTQYAKRIGYDAIVSQALTDSGVIAVPMTLALPLLNAQQDFTVFGALPIDEWNASNLPATDVVQKGPRARDVLPGLLLDKYYRTTFYAREIGEQALFGEREIMRDHYTDFYASAAHVGLLRCKHYCAPIFEVGSKDELHELSARIPKRSDEGVFYRGQTSLYTLKRSHHVRALMFGKSRSEEPSLVTSAARMNFDYDSLHFALRFFVEEDLFGAAGFKSVLSRAYQKWRKVSGRITCDIDYAIMALAQHYGLPSHGLDVTDDLDVAIWFATNKWAPGPPANYRSLGSDDWGGDPTGWPVIFACQQVTHSLGWSLQQCKELGEFGMHALRPLRQKASFFLGGHSDHQNRLGEAVVCAFRLKPGDWATVCTFNSLFPPPEEDPAYAALLRFAEIPEFSGLGAAKVARYH